MLRAGSMLSAALLAAGCFDDPSYVGKSCDLDHPCPPSHVCGLDDTCHAPALPLPDAGMAAEDCSPGAADVEGGWALALHPMLPSIEPDESRCLGTRWLEGQAFSFDAASLGISSGMDMVLIARGRRPMPGATIFDLSSSSGVRLRAGGLPVYDALGGSGGEHLTLRKYLHGPQSVVLVAALRAGAGVVSLSWVSECAQQGNPPPGVWRARYYRDLGAPDFRLDDSDCLGAEQLAGDTLYQIWNDSAPPKLLALGITDLFGAIYDARRNFAADTDVDTFHDDGLRVRLNDTLFYESWSGAQTVRRTLTFPAGDQQIQAEYFENGGLAGIHFVW